LATPAAGAVEILRQPFPGHRHADARSHLLPKWASSGFHAGSPAVFRVAGAFTVELPEVFDILEGNRGVPDDLIIGVSGFDACQV